MEAAAAANASIFGQNVSALDAVVWVVRVILPVIFFFLLYRLQQPDHEPAGNVYDRSEVMAARRAPEDEEPPEALATLRLVSETQVQKILGLPPTRGAGAGGPGRREGGGKGKGKGDKGGRGRGGARGVDNRPAAVAADLDASRLTDEEQSQLESLLSFVALRPKGVPKRVFLPDDEHPPPPPPKRRLGGPGRSGEPELSESIRLNTEAQAVLKGLTNPKFGFKCPDVTKAVSKHLEEQMVSPTEATCTLIVESCVHAGDLRAASDFLSKMEAAGHTADPELVDKVMELYTESRSPQHSSTALGGGGFAGGGGSARGARCAGDDPLDDFGFDDAPLREGGRSPARPSTAGVARRSPPPRRHAPVEHAPLRDDDDDGLRAWSDDDDFDFGHT